MTLEEQIRFGLRMCFSETNGDQVLFTERATKALLAVVEQQRREAVDEYLNRVMKLEPHVVTEIESDFASEDERLYSRLCTVFCDMFGPPMKLTESNLTELP